MKKIFLIVFLVLFISNTSYATEKWYVSILTGFLKPEIQVKCYNRNGSENNVVFKKEFNKSNFLNSEELNNYWLVHNSIISNSGYFTGNVRSFLVSVNEKYYSWDEHISKNNIDTFVSYRLIFNDKDLLSELNDNFLLDEIIYTNYMKNIPKEIWMKTVMSGEELNKHTVESSLSKLRKDLINHQINLTEFSEEIAKLRPNKINLYKCRKLNE